MNNKYVIKNCPAYNPKHCDCLNTKEIACLYRTNCVMKQIVEKLREADNFCDGIDCAECTGFYMCHSKLANDVLKLLDIQEVE